MAEIDWARAGGAGAVGGLSGATAGGWGAPIGAAVGFLGSVLGDIFSGEEPEYEPVVQKKKRLAFKAMPGAQQRGYTPPSADLATAPSFSREAETHKKAIEDLRRKYSDPQVAEAPPRPLPVPGPTPRRAAPMFAAQQGAAPQQAFGGCHLSRQ